MDIEITWISESGKKFVVFDTGLEDLDAAAAFVKNLNWLLDEMPNECQPKYPEDKG